MNKPLFYSLKNTSRKKISLKAIQYCLFFLFLFSLNQSVISSDLDPYLWLEEVEGKKSLAWVEEQNEETFTRYTETNAFKEKYERIKKELNDDERIPSAYYQNGEMYNFWRDEKNVRGVWRKTSFKSYLKDEPIWENILDIDQLANDEGINWLYKGADCLAPEYKRCLIRLSDGGTDAVTIREFDLEEKKFVKDGFNTYPSKQNASWINEDQILIGADFGEGSMNESGYPMQVKLWNRGESLEEAKIFFSGSYEKIFNFPFVSIRPDGKYYGIIEGPTFFSEVLHLFDGEKLIKINLPQMIDIHGFFKESLILSIEEDWGIFKSGSLLEINVNSLLANSIDESDVKIIFEPDGQRFISGVSIGKHQLMVSMLENVNGIITRFMKKDDRWDSKDIEGFQNSTMNIYGQDVWSDNSFISVSNFLEPSSIYHASDGADYKKIKSRKNSIDPEKYRVEQNFVSSADGTSIPYFLISRKGINLDGKNPTILYGYGGFQISKPPSYLGGSIAEYWLNSGGVYVVSNIRGGGEYGPAWHQSALKENRQRAYDDFIAIAIDLIEKGITSKDRLGIEGRSNGGLLVGATFTQRPDLFNAVICGVPLLDMYRYDKLLAGASWVDEYGDPDNPEEWEFIRKYSPYQNLKKGTEYPEVFFYTSTKDDRVHPGHARKMAKKMTDMGSPIVYYENTEGGHAGTSNIDQFSFLLALQLAYLEDKLMN
ncbi:MAG: prolyl oligopeptidase family serine peptidase [Gammaproteobacteria bacterium]|nr:prolyl oligopeptidase family serine peptidase [Gammaproteobacteria bacterium]